MVTKGIDLGNASQNDSSKKSSKDTDLKAENIDWLGDNVPVTIFRTSKKLS